MAGRARNQPLRDESENEAPDSWRKFFIILTGITNGAHQSVVRTFKSEGQTEARSPEDADYCLVFCPVSSRVGTDVSEAMEHLPAGKDAVLVVMHYTSNTEQVIPPSRRVVTDQRVQLTLDCLFYQKKLLSCELNRNMNNNIRKFFRASRSQVLFIASLGLRPQSWSIRKSSWRKFFTILTGITNGAHQSVVRTFKSEGQTEATSPEDADYCLVFCPVSSRVGTDVSEAMEHLPAGKAAVLVVMHHTFNTEQVIPLSRRLVTDPRVQLTLDCLFHQNKLLSCELNRNMENDIRKFFRASQSQVWLSIASPGLWPQSWSIRKCATCLSIMIIMFISFHSCLHHGTSTNSTVEIQSASESNKVPVMAEGLPIRDESEDEAPESWEKFFIILTGRTNGTHQSVVETLKSLGQTEATSPEEADYCLVFCPVIVQTEISEAMEHLLAGKAAVLVVMHHTFNPEREISPSSRLVTDPRVRLTLDCLFYHDKLLEGKFNRNMETSIKTFFRASQSETPQQDGRRRSMEETEYFSDSLQIPERMKELEKELKQEVDPLVKSKSSEVPAAPDVRGEPGSTDQENTDSMETPPPAGPSGSEESSLQTILQNLQKEMETLKNQNAKEMEALKKQKGEEMDTQKSQNAEVRAGHAQEIEALKKQNTEPLKEVAEQTQKGALPVKSRSRDVSVPTNSKGEVRSMDHRDTFSKKVPVMAGGLPVRDESEDKAPASWKKFFIILAGITNGAHQSVVRTFKSVGQTEARSPEDADYCLVFCPISSRVGVNVHEAMNHLLTGKAVVLVVMHHTFNPEQVIPPSRRLVTDPRVRLTLDCLFHQNKLLSCQLNKNMEKNVMEFFRAFTSKTHQSDQGVVEGFKNSFFNWITPENFKEMVHDVAELKQQVDFLVKAQSSDGPVPADREGEPGSMDQENDTDNMELQTPQQDGLKRLREEIENFSCSWQIPKRMKKLENDVAELKQEVDPLVKAKSNEVPAAPDVRGEPGSTDQENTDSMETSPPAGPSGSQDISLQKILQGLLGEMEALKNQTAKEKHHLKNQMEALKNQNTELQKEVAKLKQQVGFPAKSQSSDGSDPAESDGAPQRHVCSWNSELQQHGDSLS
ncbi:uncharacterized protein LOC115402422 isoform X3 [Salarias fasciatus]|uniref:uncharacterized protein LOC115402422 isoform X3 n=1 Tax=Salarias fasciatus TaxID=181472 RepID=UPI001176F7BB|nr:uncharacterized protein LOC115402422 isoform X3 [Salarias fasciatus]